LRETLKELIQNTIILEYRLPCSERGISKSKYTNENDHCYSAEDSNSIISIIYNSVIEYSFNEFRLANQDLLKLHTKALLTKLQFDTNHSDTFKLRYGFYGEVLLYSILKVLYKSNAFVSRGYFYQPLEKSETKGYDAYHLIEDGESIELWFGEVKFYTDHAKGISSALSNIQKAISDDYLNTNLLAISGQLENAQESNSRLFEIIESWDSNPIKLIDEINKHSIKLIYPILLVFDDKDTNYDQLINSVINKINENKTDNSFSISIDYSVFFILLPVSKALNIKKEVLKWIELKKPLI